MRSKGQHFCDLRFCEVLWFYCFHKGKKMLCTLISAILKVSLWSVGPVGFSSAQAISVVVQIITLFDLTPKYSRTLSPDMYCTENWNFHNKQVISIGGETNSGPDSEPAPLPYGEDYWQVGPIGGQWPSPGFEGQMIADRWKPPSPRRKQSGGWGGQECGGSMGVGQHHCYQAEESLAWCQPDSAYTSLTWP